MNRGAEPLREREARARDVLGAEVGSAELVATRPLCRIDSSTEHEEQVAEMVDTM